jgi:hypothetical protein
MGCAAGDAEYPQPLAGGDVVRNVTIKKPYVE